MEILLDPKIWASFLTLAALEIVLGIDNLLFITVVSGRLPAERQPAARRIGLALAVITGGGVPAAKYFACVPVANVVHCRKFG